VGDSPQDRERRGIDERLEGTYARLGITFADEEPPKVNEPART